jgi:hypothetical protein
VSPIVIVPQHPVEIGYLVDAGASRKHGVHHQINDVYVDESGLIHADDRLSGGLDIVKYIGPVPLQ